MATGGGRSPRPSWSPTRFVKARWRLLLSTVLCILLVVFLPDGYRLSLTVSIVGDAIKPN